MGWVGSAIGWVRGTWGDGREPHVALALSASFNEEPSLVRSVVRRRDGNAQSIPRRIDISVSSSGALRLIFDAGSIRPTEVAIVRLSLSRNLGHGVVFAGFSEIAGSEGQADGFLFRPYTGQTPLLVTANTDSVEIGAGCDVLALPAPVFCQVAAYLRAVAGSGREQARTRLKIDSLVDALVAKEASRLGGDCELIQIVAEAP